MSVFLASARPALRCAVRRRRAAFVALLLLVLAAGCGGPREAPLPARSVVVVIGDSITAGYGVDAGEAWPAQLAQRTGWHVVAAGVNGDRSAGGRERLPALLAAHAPALVIIELGGNDMLRGVPRAEIVANLEAMIAATRAAGAKAVLMGVPQPSALGALTGFTAAGFYREIADRTRTPLIESALPDVLSDGKLKLDALHPTAEGHKRLAEGAVGELERIGFVAPR
jgi:acyl-CoA thioesterase-1